MTCEPTMAHPGGAPTDCTEDRIAIIEEVIRDRKGSRHAAAALAGISYQTLLNWEDRGEKGEEPFAQFFDRLSRAEADAELDVSEQLLNSKLTDGPKFWLERRFPQRFGRQQTVALTGANGGPVQHEHSGRLVLTGEAALAVVAFHEDTDPEVDGVHSARADAEAGSVPEPDPA